MAAPGVFVITGADTLAINGLVFNGLMDGSVVDLSFPNNVAAGKVGKNQNAIVALNQTGFLSDMKLRLLMGSAEDKFLLNLLNQQLNNFTAFALMTALFTKNLGDGAGNVAHSSFNLAGGYFLKQPAHISNVEGNTDQAAVMWELQWLNAVRAID